MNPQAVIWECDECGDTFDDFDTCKKCCEVG